jgi:hypothetical protein
MPNNPDPQPVAKAKWRQQGFFRGLVQKQEGAGIPKMEQAHGIGITETSMVTWYSSGKEPGRKTLKLMAAYYEVAMVELTDDPGAPVCGVASEVTATMTPTKRLVTRAFAQIIGAEEVTDEAAERYLAVIDSLIKAAKASFPKVPKMGHSRRPA